MLVANSPPRPSKALKSTGPLTGRRPVLAQHRIVVAADLVAAGLFLGAGFDLFQGFLDGFRALGLGVRAVALGLVLTHFAGQSGDAFGAFLGRTQLRFFSACFAQAVHACPAGVGVSFTAASTWAAPARAGTSSWRLDRRRHPARPRLDA